MENKKAWQVLSKAGKIFNEQGEEESSSWIINESGLSNSELKKLEKFAYKKYKKLENRYFWEIENTGEDTISDILWQVIANGREFYESINIDVLNSMTENGDFRESFVYALMPLHEVYSSSETVAKVVEISLSVRVIVDKDATEDEIIAAVYPKVQEKINFRELGDNVVSIEDDEEVPCD